MSEISLNAWLQTHGRRVDFLLIELEKYRLRGSYGGSLKLNEIISLFKGAKLEIASLHKRVYELETKEKDLSDLKVVVAEEEKGEDPI